MHAPALPSTHHLVNAERLARMHDGAWLLNTARGSLVDTDALTRECVAGRLNAFVDTPDPEPLPADSPLYDLPERGADPAHRRLVGERDLPHGRPRGGRGAPLRRRRTASFTRCAPRTSSGSHDERPLDAWANPMAGNPLLTKDDVRRAVVDLVEPLVAHLSPGGARARLGTFGAHFAPRVAELEGYARPLWGIVPLVAGGGTFDHWDRWVAGLAHGTDPESAEYWGPCTEDIDQRMVEMAAIGFALAFTPEHLWDPLTGRQRDQVVEWLRGIERQEPAQNNWQFFRLLVQLGLERVGVAIDREAQSRSIELVDSFAVDDGWYTDGRGGNIDYYVPFALHTYGLVVAASGLGDRDAAARYVERARRFAPEFAHWFAR